MTEPRRDQDVHRAMPRLNWTTIALIAGLVLLLLIIGYFATNRNADQDKLTNSEITQPQPENVEKRCAEKAIYDLIKRELFHRAAELRGSDQAAYDQLSRVAVLRMDNPVMESEDSGAGSVDCSGSVSLDLPPGVAAVGGRRILMADIDYTVDASGNVALRNADSIIAPLATLARVEQPPPVTAPRESNEVAPENAVENATAPESASVQPGPPSKYPGRPSFDCNKAHSKGEIAVCSDSGLAALDVNMATQYSRSLAAATPQQRLQLQQTRERFLRYRDRCASNSCIGDAYIGRMREIRDIMEGRWQPPR